MNFLRNAAAAAGDKINEVKDKHFGDGGGTRAASTNTQLSRDPPSALFIQNAAAACPASVRMFSGCNDSQTSADVFDVKSFGLPPVSEAESGGGACTNALLSTVKRRPEITFGDLLLEMQSELKRRKYTQVPQLSSSEQVQLRDERFTVINPSSNGRTRALLIGINYFGQKGELRGCVNDVRMMRDFIIARGFSSSRDSMRILTDDTTFTDGQPTGDNILAGMQWLVEGAKAGDSLFIHFSGHGTQMPESVAGSEEDGLDEALVPLDYMTEGLIRDDTIYQVLVSRLPKGVHLVCVFDCCHSGSICDLPFVFTATDEGCAALSSGSVGFLGANNFFNFDAAIKLAKEAAEGIIRGLASHVETARGLIGK